MSTSRQKSAPVDYMNPGGANVLWQLYPQPESDSGFHRGADITILSQFAVEEEVLFPPCTMLIVKPEPKYAAAVKAKDSQRIKRIEAEHTQMYSKFSAHEETKDGRHFLSVDVLPTFL